MESKIAESNAVIVAQNFNPSILSQIWLLKNDIMYEEEFEAGSLFMPMICQVPSKEFNFVALPERLQFSVRREVVKEKEKELVLSKLGSIVRKLPHTPYTAAGLNFIWHIIPQGEDLKELDRSIFYRSDSPLYAMFDTEDARFGAYLSRDIFGHRLKLDIKPVTMPKKTMKEELLQFSFNFHCELFGENRVDKIIDLLGKWDEARDFSEKIINNLIK